MHGRLDIEHLNTFLHETASCIKTLLRPTDTISRFADSLFLILIEDVSREDIPSRIAGRVEQELRECLSSNPNANGVRAYVGIVLCDAGYKDEKQILSDIDLARQLAKNEKNYVLYDRDTLAIHRNSVPE
jgi:GGDEF domain-containing protein